MNPKVSFIVPCYKLAHLLSECVHSILAQSYQDHEILIMDDCSPDNTPEVARSFNDPRVKHIRNEPNLGHLANYNKGIGLASGKYIWHISADDSLRCPDLLQRYVDLMERHPNVGYAICPGVSISHGKDQGVLSYSVLGSADAIFHGREFLLTLLERNRVIAAAGMVRRECYERHGVFPLDMPFGGDWYLWCLFAFHYDVGYLAEPMVNYRQHDLSMTNLLRTESERTLMRDDISLPWRIRKESERVGDFAFAARCIDFIVKQYVRGFLPKEWRNPDACLTVPEFESSLQAFTSSKSEQFQLRARVFFEVGDHCYWDGDSVKALTFYRHSLRERFWTPSLWLKYLLLRMGRAGELVRQGSIPSFGWRKDHRSKPGNG